MKNIPYWNQAIYIAVFSAIIYFYDSCSFSKQSNRLIEKAKRKSPITLLQYCNSVSSFKETKKVSDSTNYKKWITDIQYKLLNDSFYNYNSYEVLHDTIFINMKSNEKIEYLKKVNKESFDQVQKVKNKIYSITKEFLNIPTIIDTVYKEDINKIFLLENKINSINDKILIQKARLSNRAWVELILGFLLFISLVFNLYKLKK